VRAALITLLAGLTIAVIVDVATGGHVILLPLIFVPLLFFWPVSRKRS
jgi:hypothetical protein